MPVPRDVTRRAAILIRVPAMTVLRGPMRLYTLATSILYTPVPTMASDPTSAMKKGEELKKNYIPKTTTFSSPPIKN